MGCQTFESSLAPCDACQHAQSVLRKTGDALVEILQRECLPSSLQPLMLAVDESLGMGLMTAGDVAQWATEQCRDMRRLSKHLQEVRATVKPLQGDLEKAEAERVQLRSQLEQVQRRFRQDVDRHQANVVQLEFALRKAQRSVKQLEQNLQEEQKKHKKGVESVSFRSIKPSAQLMLLSTGTQCMVEDNFRLKEEVGTQEKTLQTIGKNLKRCRNDI